MTAVQDRVAELEKAIEAKKALADGIIDNRVKVDGENVQISPEDFTQVKNLLGEVGEINTLIEATKMGVSTAEMKNLQGQYAQQNAAQSAAMALAAGASLTPMQAKTLGEMFVGSDEFKSLIRSGGSTMASAYELDVQNVAAYGTYGQKDVFNGSGNHTITHGFGRIQFDPTVPRAQRAARVRDLFNVATTSANLIDFFRVTGFVEQSGEGAAAPVRDRAGANGTDAPTGGATDTFGLKPKSNLQFTSDQAPVRTIAHWEAAHRNILQDEPQMQSTINNELLYGLALEEDNQLINGDGTNENLRGILHTPGTQSHLQSANAGDTKADALRRAATKAIIANYAPSGYVIHPYDWEDIELSKDNEDRYLLVTNVAIGAETRIWRQPVIETVAMQQGKFVTGAWGIGAQLYDRQVANVRIAEQHADFFVRNALAILVEERLAFAVKRPESFVVGTFDV